MTDNDFLLNDLHGREGSFLPCHKNAGRSEENLDVTEWIKYRNMDSHATTSYLRSECPYIKFQVSCLLPKRVLCQHHPQPVPRYLMNILPSSQQKHH
jgi:hypothetical protein